MKTAIITLGESVSVSDPCYIPAQRKLNIVSGKYRARVNFSASRFGAGAVCSLSVVHKDFIMGSSKWKLHQTISVDSGQAGIFCDTTYRNDEVANGYIGIDFFQDYLKNWARDRQGEKFYAMITDQTINKDWATYGSGVASQSGYGDGEYNVYTMCNSDGRIVGIKIKFL